jgi:hypothetical protein
MPGGSIASPSLRPDEVAGTDPSVPTLKKKKSVMGRLKSTISTKLGRRKSLSSETVTSPTDKDLSARQSHPEAQLDAASGGSSRLVSSLQQQDEEEADDYADDYEEDDMKRSSHGVDTARDLTDRTDSMTTTSAASPFNFKNMLTAKTPLMHLEQLPDSDQVDDGGDKDDSPAVSSSEQPTADVQSNQHVAASVKSLSSSPLRSARPINFSEMEEDDEQQGEAIEEVFAVDYSGGCAPAELVEGKEELPPQQDHEQDDDEDQLEVFDDGQGGNQAPAVLHIEDDVNTTVGPAASLADGLMIIGRSPAKAALNWSPEKRLRPLSHIPEGLPEGLPPPQMPEESALAAPRVPSPVKPARSGGSSPMPSPTKKAITSDHQSRRPSEHMERIQEEDKAGSPVKMQRPSAPSAARRRSSVKMDAPILASAFIASRIDPEEEEEKASGDLPRDLVDDEGSSADQEAKEEESSLSTTKEEASAFAFDAGAAITQAFGDRVARLLGADPWGDRQDGFDAIQYAVRKTDLSAAGNKRELLCAALAAVQCGVEDRVAPVMYCALECLRQVLKEFASVLDRSFSRFAPLNEQLSSLLQALVGKLGDANKRTQRETTQAIARLAKLRKLRALPHVLLHLSGKDVAPRLQLEMLRRLVQDLGLGSPAENGKPSKNGSSSQQPQLTLDMVMQFVSPSLKLADEKTRKAAVELLADLQFATSPAAVNAQLAGLKPDLLRVITRRVDELVAQREIEKQQQQQQQQCNTNQSEEQRSETEEADAKRAAELMVPVLPEDSRAAMTLLEAQLNAAPNVVGPVVWRKLLSKTWSDRKEALVDLGRAVTEAKSDLRDAKPAFGSVIQQNFCAYCVVAHKFLGDAIQPVVNEALDLLTTLIKIFGACVEWREESVRDLTVLTLSRLFQTMQKPQNRTTRAACRCVLKLTRLPNSQHPLRYTLSCVFDKNSDPGVQMHLLRLLVPELGFQPEGLSASLVLAAVASALGHSSDKVRKVASDVALATQRLVGRALVLEKLKDVKPSILKELEKNFVDIERDATDRPQTVHAGSAVGPTVGGTSGALPPVQFSSDRSRRQLNSAPVGIGRLQCTPQDQEEDEDSGEKGIPVEMEVAPPSRRPLVLSNDEENLMDAILGNGDF